MAGSWGTHVRPFISLPYLYLGMCRTLIEASIARIVTALTSIKLTYLNIR